MFDISSLQYSSENPTFLAIAFTVLCAVFLGIIIAFTYEKTSRSVDRPDHFLQALVLITIVAAMIMQAIGDSVARGLGMLGALSIIRFRTTLRNPRNIVFMFSAIAAGIACGVLGFVIAIVGTIGFCATAFLLRISSFNNNDRLIGLVNVDIRQQVSETVKFEDLLSKFCKKKIVLRERYYSSAKKNGLKSIEYEVLLSSSSNRNDFYRALEACEFADVTSVRFQSRPIKSL